MNDRRMAYSVLGLMLLAALALLGAAAGRRFDGLYGQDSFAYFNYAVGPLAEALRDGRMPPPFFWPPGYPLLVALAAVVAGPVPQAGQAVSLAAGLLVPVFTALLAYEVLGAERQDLVTPLLAGVLAAFVGQLWQSGLVVMADTTGLAAATAGMWALARYGRRRSAGWLALAALLLAFAILTRWAYALVAIVAAGYALRVLVQQPLKPALVAAIPAAVAATVVLVPVWFPALRGAVDPATGQPAFAGDLTVYSWHPANALLREFTTPDGLLSYRLPNGLWYALAPAHRYYFTPMLAPFVLVGVAAVIRNRREATLWLVLGWAAVVYLFHAGAPWQNFRFNLAYLPPLAVLGAAGLVSAAGWLSRTAGKGGIRRFLPALLVVWTLAGLIAMAAGGWTLSRSFIERKDADLALIRATEAVAGPGAALVTFNLTPSFRQYSRLHSYDLYAVTETELAGLVAAETPAYLLVNVDEIEGQWRGRAPWVAYSWLQEHAQLERVWQSGPYTLFRIAKGL